MKYLIFLFTLVFIHSFRSFSQVISRIESVQSLFVETFRDSIFLNNATAFIIRSKTQNYLVTNYHVVTNKDVFAKTWVDSTKKISPNKILIFQNGKVLGQYKIKSEPLLDSLGNPVWYESSIKNGIIDVVELPLKDTNDISIYPVAYKSPLDTLIFLRPTDRVFVLGFPLGTFRSPYLPVWKSGLIASEPDLDQKKMPLIYIDAITYPGMSGSPVYYISNEINGKANDRIEFPDLQSIFVGVFSAQQVDNVFGVMWKAKFLQTIFDKLP
jgi:hypothetical protein